MEQNIEKNKIRFQELLTKDYENDPAALVELGEFYLCGWGVTPLDLRKAYWCFEAAAQKDNVDAICYVGICHDNGDVVDSNREKALECYRRAAAGGHPYAIILQYMDEPSAVPQQDVQSALRILHERAIKGDVMSVRRVAVCYKLGYATPKNFKEAYKYFRIAAENGLANAQYDVALCYEEGHGVKQSNKKALEWYLRSAEQGYSYGQYNLAVLYQNSPNVKNNNALSVFWYEKAAAQNHPEALNNLALRYEEGSGVPKDHQRAFELYLKASSLGNATATSNIGNCYYYGWCGVSINKKRAFEYYLKSALLNHPKAMYSVARLYKEGDGVEENPTESVVWFTKASEKNYSDSYFQAGVLWEQGFGVPKDLRRAKHFYETGASLNCQKCKSALDSLTNTYPGIL